MSGPVLFAYDGSELAGHAITEAGRQLRPGRDALVLTIWEPTDVGFVPVGGAEFNAERADEVRAAAEKTASQGASLDKFLGGGEPGWDSPALLALARRRNRH